MKTLTVYIKGDFFKYTNLFEDFTHEIDSDGLLRLIERVLGNQYEEHEVAVFRNWDYYLIEEGHEI